MEECKLISELNPREFEQYLKKNYNHLKMEGTKVKFTSDQIEAIVNSQISYSEDCFDIYLSEDMIVVVNNGYCKAIMDFCLSYWDEAKNAWKDGSRVRVAKQDNFIDDVCYGIEQVLDKEGLLEW